MQGKLSKSILIKCIAYLAKELEDAVYASATHDALCSACDILYTDLMRLALTPILSDGDSGEEVVETQLDPITGQCKVLTASLYRLSVPPKELLDRLHSHIQRQKAAHSADCTEGYTRYYRAVILNDNRTELKPMKHDISSRLIRFFGSDNLLRLTIQHRSQIAVRAFLEDGAKVSVAGRTFRGVCILSPTGLREGKIWLVADDWRPADAVAASLGQQQQYSSEQRESFIRGMLGVFQPTKWLREEQTSFPPGKFCAQLGLLCSQAFATVEIPTNYIIAINEIERNGYCFSDGCSFIGSALAKRIADKLGLSHVPSVFQFRFRGMKGVAAVYADGTRLDVSGVTVDGNAFYYRPSQVKFSTDERPLMPEQATFFVCESGYSRPMAGALDRQKLNLLCAMWKKCQPTEENGCKSVLSPFEHFVVCAWDVHVYIAKPRKYVNTPSNRGETCQLFCQ